MEKKKKNEAVHSWVQEGILANLKKFPDRVHNNKVDRQLKKIKPLAMADVLFLK